MNPCTKQAKHEFSELLRESVYRLRSVLPAVLRGSRDSPPSDSQVRPRPPPDPEFLQEES
jgi:hypothetical protein